MKLNIFSKKNLLDEMQEQKLLKVESRSFWLMWWSLLIAMLVQRILGGATAKELAGEWIVFMIACLYSLVECLRNGIWDRHFRATLGANLLGSPCCRRSRFSFEPRTARLLAGRTVCGSIYVHSLPDCFAGNYRRIQKTPCTA